MISIPLIFSLFNLFRLLFLCGLLAVFLLSLASLVSTKFLVRMIEWRNQARGVKTEITPATIRFSRIGAFIGVAFSVIVFLVIQSIRL